MAQIPTEQESLFLETTIQIERVIGEQGRRDTIRHNIHGRNLCTSGHVLGEFNRTLIKDAIIFRDLLYTSPSVEEAVKRLGRYIPSHRKYRRTIALLAFLGFDGDRQATLERLEDFIEWKAHDHFWDSIDKACFADEVGCVLKAWSPKRNDRGEYDIDGLKCLKENPPSCQVQAFIKQHRQIIEKIISSADHYDRPNLARAAKAFTEILSGKDVPFGERSNCYPISDALIVLEAPSDVAIYSTDGDVHDLCEILDKQRYIETTIKM